MKTINIFGRKMPIVAILMALLIVGTASAAVFVNYATLSGNVDVTSDINVNNIDIGGSGILEFASPAMFAINNVGDEPVIVELVTTIFDGDSNIVNDLESIGVDYSVLEGDGVEGGEVLVPPGGLNVLVDFNTEVNTVPDSYTIQVDVNPHLDNIPYEDFEGDNEMVCISMTHKIGNDYTPDGDESELVYIPMGNEFYYELEAVELVADTSYALIYYADEIYDENDILPTGKSIGDDKWGGTNEDAGIVIDIFVSESDGTADVSGHHELTMNVPSMPDENNDEGAKIWVVPTSHLTNGDSLPMVAWDQSAYLFEYSEILNLDYDDLVRYIDTNL